MGITYKQKKLIEFINKKLGYSSEESREIIRTLKTVKDASDYIARYYPVAMLRDLTFEELDRVSCYLSEKAERLKRKVKGNEKKINKEEEDGRKGCLRRYRSGEWKTTF